MATRIHRVVGDTGQLARITATLTDKTGQPLTAGTTTIRAHGLFQGTMTHDSNGVWHYDPAAGDLTSRGIYPLEITHDTITLPADSAIELDVRARTSPPPA